MLKLDALHYRQGDFSLTADLEVAAGAAVALLGPSGAGKSTLFNLIAGFLVPASGRVLWQGDDITHRLPGQRPVAMLFQDNNLFPHLDAASNVGLGIRPDLRLTPAERDHVKAALARVGLDGMGGRKPASLSGGQRGRVALARLVVQNRPLILLDEPFSALGPALKSEMLDLVADLARDSGATLIMITHDPGDAMAIAEQTILLADGVAEPPKSTRALLSDPPEALRRYLGSGRGADGA